MLRPYFRTASALLLCMTGIPASATVGNLANSFGLMPGDAGTAQASAALNHSPSVAYYNPAQLADHPGNELELGYLYSDPKLEIHSKGGAAPIPRSGGSVAESTNNNTILIGLKLSVDDMLKPELRSGFGLLMGMDDNANSLMRIEDKVSADGQFLQYGEKPLFLAGALGFEVYQGVLIGVGTHITVASDAPVKIESKLDGETSEERVSVKSRTSFSALLGLTLDWHRLLCFEHGDCEGKNWKNSFSYRGENDFSLDLEANAVIPGTINDPGLDLIIAATDAYQPSIYNTTLEYRYKDHLAFYASAEFQQWSDLTEKLKEKTRNAVKDQSGAEFEDTVVPRLGMHWNDMGSLVGLSNSKELNLQFGYAFDKSPLKDGLTVDANLLDNDKHILAMGANLTFKEPWLFVHPLTVKLTYQHHALKSRDFDLSRSEPEPLVYETVETKGSVNMISASITSRF